MLVADGSLSRGHGQLEGLGVGCADGSSSRGHGQLEGLGVDC